MPLCQGLFCDNFYAQLRTEASKWPHRKRHFLPRIIKWAGPCKLPPLSLCYNPNYYFSFYFTPSLNCKWRYERDCRAEAVNIFCIIWLLESCRQSRGISQRGSLLAGRWLSSDISFRTGKSCWLRCRWRRVQISFSDFLFFAKFKCVRLSACMESYRLDSWIVFIQVS